MSVRTTHSTAPTVRSTSRLRRRSRPTGSAPSRPRWPRAIHVGASGETRAVNRRLYLIAAVALTVIAGVSVYIATRVNPADISNNSDLNVLANSVPSVVGAKGWINSPALGPADLRGKVVLYDFWTYSCVNCQRTLPHLKTLYERYKGEG